MRHQIIVPALLVVLLGWSAVGSARTPSATPVEVAAEQLTLQGKVVERNASARTFIIENASGDRLEVRADAAVRNFDRIKVGDIVEMDYLDAVAVSLEPANSEVPGAYEEQSAAVAKKGRKPAAAVTDTVTVIAPVKAVDAARHTVTLALPDKRNLKVQVKQPALQARLAEVKVGEQVRMVFTEAVVVAVRKPHH